ncbi:hypothetical protein S-CBP42_0028 [Synechococcus phage S-CBP42]|uniref:Uncharacterized protein n=1 Tax=Synechococcus phage S-CBP42 TaxID=461711 RepID=A0A096VKU0_9CAUD|nr:hypothetical protein AVU76_gp28 [Synechococcus phage S-CBP42]AGK86679.1 hypothetical protein S-CBP42_0028 [Synechococcus phage S-CBP42]
MVHLGWPGLSYQLVVCDHDPYQLCCLISYMIEVGQMGREVQVN